MLEAPAWALERLVPEPLPSLEYVFAHPKQDAGPEEPALASKLGQIAAIAPRLRMLPVALEPSQLPMLAAHPLVQRLETLWISISGSFDLRLLEVLRPLPLARCIVRVSSSLLPATDFASWPGLELVDEYAPVHDAFRQWD